jgi:hypothetical protein
MAQITCPTISSAALAGTTLGGVAMGAVMTIIMFAILSIAKRQMRKKMTVTPLPAHMQWVEYKSPEPEPANANANRDATGYEWSAYYGAQAPASPSRQGVKG